jgi:hypothetical protein
MDNNTENRNASNFGFFGAFNMHIPIIENRKRGIQRSAKYLCVAPMLADMRRIETEVGRKIQKMFPNLNAWKR